MIQNYMTQAIYTENDTIAQNGMLAMAQGQETVNTVPMMELPYHMYNTPSLASPSAIVGIALPPPPPPSYDLSLPYVAPMIESPYETPVPTVTVEQRYLHVLEQLAEQAIAHCDKAVIDEIFSHLYA